MVWRVASTLGAASLIPALWVQYAIAGNTTCASNQLNWYSSVVGESPCVTYQRLRQICNSDYQVPNFRPDTPGDQCDDQVSACCCNTVAFQLSMLCMNCQYDTQDGDQIGIDAGVGAYQLYQSGCGAGTNNSLSSDIQAGVCNQGIRLDDFLYGGWDDGSWFYVWTKENAERTHAANSNETFTHCPNDSSPSSTPGTTSSTTTSSNTPTSLNTPTPSVNAPTSSSSTSTSTSSTTSSSSTSSTPRTNSTSSTLSSTSSDSAAVALITKSASLDVSSLTTPTATSGNATSGSGSHSNTGAILGGAIGGVVGGIIIIGVGVIFWCMGRNKKFWTSTTPDPHSSYHDGHSMGSAAPMVTRASLWTSEGPHDVPPLATATFASPPGSHSGHSNGPSSAAFSDDALRHEDGGPVFGLYRSPSGRLPPAYRSWERGTDSGGSNSGPGSVSGERPRSGYSEAQSFGAPPSHTELAYIDPPSTTGLPRPLPSPGGFDPSMPPLAPVRRSSTMKGWSSS